MMRGATAPQHDFAAGTGDGLLEARMARRQHSRMGLSELEWPQVRLSE